MSKAGPAAVLLISCPDRRGLIAGVTDFIYRNNGNIEHLDQHVDPALGVFFMRIEWSLDGFSVPRERIHTDFSEVAAKFSMEWKLHFSDERPKFAIFVSKSLHCLYDILSRYREGWFNAEIPVIISNHRDAEDVAGVIEAIEEQTILGEIRKYYVMRMPLNDMKVMIPMENVAEIGVRPIISLEDVGRVFSVLSADVTKMPQNWNRRYRANMDHIKSGDIFEVAEVVRNLMLRDREKSLSTGERKILNNARQILLSEIILAGNLQEVEVNNMIENVIK